MSKRLKYPPNFEKFWQAYPRKTAKPNALKAWEKLGAEDDAFLPAQIIQDVEKRSRFKWWDSQKFIPHPATWLNAQRWEDEGWEDDIAAAKGQKPSGGTRYVPYQPPVHAGPELSGWHMMVNRIARSYILASGGMTDEQIRQALSIKYEVLDEYEPVANEELREGKSTRPEMAHLIAETFLNRCDRDLRLNLKERVLANARRRAA